MLATSARATTEAFPITERTRIMLAQMQEQIKSKPIASVTCGDCGHIGQPLRNGTCANCDSTNVAPHQRAGYKVSIGLIDTEGDRIWFVAVTDPDYSLTVLNHELLSREEARALARRAHKATQIMQAGHVQRDGCGWRVESQSHPGHYYHINGHGCPCVDSRQGNGECKHIIAIRLRAGRQWAENFDGYLAEVRYNPTVPAYSDADLEAMEGERIGEPAYTL